MPRIPNYLKHLIPELNGPKQHKYSVAAPERRTFDGRVYASRAEALYAQKLRLVMQSGSIIEVVEQPRVELGCRENVYHPDFLVIQRGVGHEHAFVNYYVDVKGMETAKFKRDKKLWARYGRLTLIIVELNGDHFEIKEQICPQPKDPNEETQ